MTSLKRACVALCALFVAAVAGAGYAGFSVLEQDFNAVVNRAANDS